MRVIVRIVRIYRVKELRAVKVMDICVHFLLGKALQKVNQISKSKLSPYGVTPVQFALLNILWKKDGQVGAKLGKVLQLDSATITGLLDRLETNGFIERRVIS
ncbi:hypothetical protein CN514_12700, partial [Bacillus sp. AFS001701]